MYLKLTNDHTASFYNNESMNDESKVSLKFNPCHCPDNDVTQGVKYTFFDSSEMVNPADPVLEPDPSVFKTDDLR